MKKTLTATVITATKPGPRELVVVDDAIAGYQLKVTPAGRRVLSVLFWSPVEPGRRRRVTIGEVGQPVAMPDGTTAALTAHTGRRIASAIRGAIDAGRDPYLERIDRAQEQAVRVQADRARREAAQPVSLIVEAFLEDARGRGLSSITVREWSRLLGKHVLPVIGERPIAEVGRADADAVRRALPRDRPVLANRVQQVSCSLLNFAAELRPGLANPFVLGRRGAGRWFKEQLTRSPLTRDELSRLLEVLDEEPRVYRGDATDAIRLLAFTGWRKREVLSLRWDEINFDTGVVALGRTKTGRSVRALSPSALALLREIPQRGEYVFPSPRSPRAPLYSIARPWSRIRSAAGITKPLHALRHTAASIALSEGVPLAAVGALLGHRDASTTLRYAKIEEEAARNAAKVLGAAIDSTTRSTALTPISSRRRAR